MLGLSEVAVEDSNKNDSSNISENWKDVTSVDVDVNSEKNIDIENESDKNENSFNNIIPLAKLRNGWFAVSSLITQTAAKVQEKAVETYNSESVQNFKQKTTEVIVPAWEKTKEATVPIWNRTVEISTPVWEKTKASAYTAVTVTKENVALAAENLRPTVETVELLYLIFMILFFLFAYFLI
jgi:hypothetical protein